MAAAALPSDSAVLETEVTSISLSSRVLSCFSAAGPRDPACSAGAEVDATSSAIPARAKRIRPPWKRHPVRIEATAKLQRDQGAAARNPRKATVGRSAHDLSQPVRR